MAEENNKTGYGGLSEQEQEKMLEAMENIKASILQSWECVARIFNEWLDSVSEVWEQAKKTFGEFYSISFSFAQAYCWACDAHPEWVAVLNRTKKKRTRKKYQDRIMRAYLKSKEGSL